MHSQLDPLAGRAVVLAVAAPPQRPLSRLADKEEAVVWIEGPPGESTIKVKWVHVEPE